VKDLPAGFDDRELAPALSQDWGIALDTVEYSPLGYGSYHWIVTDTDDQRFFVTVDDLTHKPWLGDTCDDAFSGLRKAFDVALALRDRCELNFVLAPRSTIAGETVRRIGAQHTIAVFPFVDGEAGDFGEDISAQHRADIVRMLIDLHRATPVVQHLAQPLTLGFAGRAGLEVALTDLDCSWQSGPFGERARALVATHARGLMQRLDDFAQLVRTVSAVERRVVISHGEPHPGNVMRTRAGLMLIDWDTVGLALPERDLWLVADASSDEVAMYVDATGHPVSPAAMSLYQQAWALADIASYLEVFRSPHQQTQDTEEAWTLLEQNVRDDAL
jgi:spectinomycin phosphotransferase